VTIFTTVSLTDAIAGCLIVYRHAALVKNSYSLGTMASGIRVSGPAQPALSCSVSPRKARTGRFNYPVCEFGLASAHAAHAFSGRNCPGRPPCNILGKALPGRMVKPGSETWRDRRKHGEALTDFGIGRRRALLLPRLVPPLFIAASRESKELSVIIRTSMDSSIAEF
jgi:hypothetical protein